MVTIGDGRLEMRWESGRLRDGVVIIFFSIVVDRDISLGHGLIGYMHEYTLRQESYCLVNSLL